MTRMSHAAGSPVTTDPLFTVLLPVHRPPVLLPTAIESVQSQTRSDFELLVVCDGAPSDTVACARSFADRDERIRVFTFDKGERFGERHRHTTLQSARGRYIAHVCDDDFWLNDHLAAFGHLLSEVDFGNTLQLRLFANGSATVLPSDLSNADLRRRMVEERFNCFGLTFGGYRLDAYRRLPDGWTAAPEGLWTDLHMWRKFLRRSDLRFGTSMTVTAVNLPVLSREHMTLDQRAAETRMLFARFGDPTHADAIKHLAWRSVVQHAVDLDCRLAKAGESRPSETS